MRLNKRSLFLKMAAAMWVLLLGAACSSYRICGFSGNGSVPVAIGADRRFRITDLRISFNSSVKDNRFVFTSAACSPQSQLIERIQAARPDVFSTAEDAEQIKVNLAMRSGRVEGKASILLYIFSLCTLPVWENYISEGCAAVSLADGQQDAANGPCVPLRFESNQKFTFYSPIGLIPYGDGINATETRKRSFAFAPRTEDLNAVFALTAADAIAKAVRMLDERKTAARPALRVVPTAAKEKAVMDVKKSKMPIRDPGKGKQFNEPSPNCAICGAVKDASGNCPLCTGGDN